MEIGETILCITSGNKIKKWEKYTIIEISDDNFLKWCIKVSNNDWVITELRQNPRNFKKILSDEEIQEKQREIQNYINSMREEAARKMLYGRRNYQIKRSKLKMKWYIL